MARPRKYDTREEAEEANRVQTRERKKLRNRLRREAKLAMQAHQVDPAKQVDQTTYTVETREKSIELGERESELKLFKEQAVKEQLVWPLS